MTTSQVLQHLYSLDTSSPDFPRYLYCLIQHDEEDQYLSSLEGLELIRLVNFLDDILGVAPIVDDVFRRCLHKLRTICSRHAILPSSYTISGHLSRVDDGPVAFGGFSDVWEGLHNGVKVCIKHLRVSEKIRKTIEKAFYKEAIIWKRLRHPNVISFIGVTRDPLQFVSEWMPNGTLTEYVNENPGANRVGLLLDVAEGLNYLHATHTTHGDLKGPNILIDSSGHACLTDFGFASVVRGLSSVLITEVQGYTARWAAPEVLASGDRSTQEADIFAFGMVVVEVFTGMCPFSDFTAMVTVSKIMDGERPDRPQGPGLTDSVWDMTRTCWRHDPAHRPTISKVVGILRECYRQCATDLHLSSLSLPQPVGRVVEMRGVGHISLPLGSHNAARRINQISGELMKVKEGVKGELYDELLGLCRSWRAVPASYELRGVAKQGDHAEHYSLMATVWKGIYGGEEVALKVVELAQDGGGWTQNSSYIMAAQQDFCAGAVLMKQLEHNNILPFYGVATTFSEFSLVFPWYKNGNIDQYLENNPGVDRYDLLLGVVNGLVFLHSNGLVHGDLKPSHILIDDDGNARLIIDLQCTSPEVLPCMELEIDCSTESPTRDDVYAVAMVIYEVLTGISPHWESPSWSQGSEVQRTDKTPMRPPGAIDDRIWEFLEKCWSKPPLVRPQVDEVYLTLKSFPKTAHIPRMRPPIGESPRVLALHFQSIKLSEVHRSWRQFYVKSEFGDKVYKTSPTNDIHNEYERGWSSPQTWVIETAQLHGQYNLTFEVLMRTSPLRKDKVYARGDFNPTGYHANKNIAAVLIRSGVGRDRVDVNFLAVVV